MTRWREVLELSVGLSYAEALCLFKLLAALDQCSPICGPPTNCELCLVCSRPKTPTLVTPYFHLNRQTKTYFICTNTYKYIYERYQGFHCTMYMYSRDDKYVTGNIAPIKPTPNAQLTGLGTMPCTCNPYHIPQHPTN